MGHNREKFGALLKSIIGNLKSIIGSGLERTVSKAFNSLEKVYHLFLRKYLIMTGGEGNMRYIALLFPFIKLIYESMMIYINGALNLLTVLCML